MPETGLAADGARGLEEELGYGAEDLGNCVGGPWLRGGGGGGGG